VIPCIPFLAAALAVPTDTSWSGLPRLEAATPYRIVTESVTATIEGTNGRGVSGLYDVESLTQYRNIGAVGRVTIHIPWPTGAAGDHGAPVVWWDGQRVATNRPPESNEVRATASFKANGTHSLKIDFSAKLARWGEGSRQVALGYKLAGGQAVELFTMAFKYSNRVVFTLPTIEPDLGWQIGYSGAATRQTNFVPGDRVVQMIFYPNGFEPIG
jgi:hypothetical protein